MTPAGIPSADSVLFDLESLEISEGPEVGQPFETLPWERDFVHGFCGRRVSALTIARGNGKTALVAGIAVSTLVGELMLPRGQTVIVAASMKQAGIAFQHVRWFMMDKMRREHPRWRTLNSNQDMLVQDRETGATVKCIGSNADKAHGLAPSLVLADEPAKWMKGGGAMYAAIKTALGKQRGSKMVALGTVPDLDGHWFRDLLNSPSDTTYAQVHMADKDEDPFAESTIRKANPSYDHMEELRNVIEDDKQDAMEQGGLALSSFKALRLNMGTPEIEGKEPLIEKEDWEAATVGMPQPREGGVCVGVDLGGGDSMSACAFYWPVTGRLEAYGCFPAQPSLANRGKRDGVGERYVNMARRGELIVYPGRATNNVRFLKDMFARIEGQRVVSYLADHYKKRDLEQALLEAGLPMDVEWRRVGRGPDGGADVRAFQAEVLTGHLKTTRSLILESALASCVLHRDENGNPAINRLGSRDKYDVLQASLLAVGRGRRERLPQAEEDDNGGIARFYQRMLGEGAPLMGAA